MGNDHPKMANNQQYNQNTPNQNQMPTQELFIQQVDGAIEQNSSNNTISKAQFNRILSLLGLDSASINHTPILDGLFELIEPVNVPQAKPKYNVKQFIHKMIQDRYFLIQRKIHFKSNPQSLLFCTTSAEIECSASASSWK